MPPEEICGCAWAKSTTATPYPGKETEMVPCGVIDCVEGPAEGLVLALMAVTVASENEPSAETSSVTLAATPGPLLSLELRTAWLASRITTEPSSLRTASASSALVFELFTCKMVAPGGEGNR